MSRAGIETLNQEFGKAFSNQDARAVVGFYAQDAKLLAPGAPLIDGQAGIEAFLQQMFASGARGLELNTLDVLEADDLAVEVGRYTMTIQPPGGDVMRDVGKYVAVWRRQADGGLKLVVDTFNSDSPAS
jgi:uncharacterized protein (TIGR02246 family)